MAADEQPPPWIVVAENGVLNAIDLMVDEKGADFLIERLQEMKRRKSHLHVETDPVSPYGHAKVYPEIIISWVDRD